MDLSQSNATNAKITLGVIALYSIIGALTYLVFANS